MNTTASYINKRLSEMKSQIGGTQPVNDINDTQKELEALRQENARLKERLEQSPHVNFKSEVQTAFEQSPEFEQLLNVFYMRFMRSKFSDEFRNSPYIQEFQEVANKAFEQFEKSYSKQTGGVKNGPAGKKDTKGVSGADAGKSV